MKAKVKFTEIDFLKIERGDKEEVELFINSFGEKFEDVIIDEGYFFCLPGYMEVAPGNVLIRYDAGNYSCVTEEYFLKTFDTIK